MMDKVIKLSLFAAFLSTICNAGITIQNTATTSKHNVSFHLQDISNLGCPNEWIIAVQIYLTNIQITGWVDPSAYTSNTGNGDKYIWDCTAQNFSGISNCEFELPLSVKFRISKIFSFV